jgi:hypothetical protein
MKSHARLAKVMEFRARDLKSFKVRERGWGE